eukprot:COSAG01_NODE_52463_length_346_cov_1.255061_1_plen_107_part_01
MFPLQSPFPLQSQPSITSLSRCRWLVTRYLHAMSHARLRRLLARHNTGQQASKRTSWGHHQLAGHHHQHEVPLVRSGCAKQHKGADNTGIIRDGVRRTLRRGRSVWE